ncbi:hypothetical protein GOP47_0019659 [Adiantum capillus-veneris]|uniref:At4g14310 8-bladed propeller domain-containing protein n=1 Tax=Adiantum capillus-veneris TaxID=13818 RepID=A0A9D4UCZ1_ADICA|nr:hypothetical protein GOP47_0019659 [Adiantum capillus-veneris]
MSPQRKKGRGGAGSKIVAPRSSLAIDSPDPLVPLKLVRERRASTTQLSSSSKSKQLKAEAPLSRFPAADQAKAEQARIFTSEQDQVNVIFVEGVRSSNVASSSHQPRNQAVEQACTVPLSQVRPNATEQSKGLAALTIKSSVTEKARASSATRTRVSSVENFRSLIASSRCVPPTAGDVSNGSHGSSRRLSTKLRAESRPRSSKASPGTSTSSKCPSERVCNEPSKSSTLALLTRGRLSSSMKEDGKKLAKAPTMLPACSENPKVCPSSSEKARSREPLRNLKNCQREATTETSRLSSTTIPSSVQNSRKGNLGDDFQGGVSSTKPGQNRQPAVQHGRLSTGSYNLPVGNTMKYTSDAATAISRVALKRRNEQNVANETEVSEPVHEKEHSATSNLSTSLHKRLALLEGKVSQMASEIKKTREMLANDGYTNSADLLIDIQGKITSIERFMSCKESSKSASNMEKDVNMEDRLQVQPTTDNVGEYRPTLQSFNTDKYLHSSQVPVVSEHEFYLKHTFLRGSVSAPPKVSGLVYDPQYVEFYPHRILVRNCLSFQEKEVENKTSDEVLLERAVDSQSMNPNAGLHDNRTSCVMIGEKMPCTRKTDTLDEKVALNGGNCVHSKSSDVCPRADSIQHVQENTASQHGQYSIEQGACTQGPTMCAEDIKDVLECNESPLSDSFPENTENIAPDDGVYFDDDEFVPNQLHPIGDKVATAGWYVSEGEAILLTHDDGCCSYYDVANMEEKAVYAAPNEVSSILWNDCWLIRAAGSDGRANKYMVATTAGNALDCGFCSWDFYSKRLAACHTEKQSTPPMGSSPGSPIQRSLNFSLQPSARSTMGLLSSDSRMSRSERASLTFSATNTRVPDTLLHHPPTTYLAQCCGSPQWWYRPCGPLMASAASSLKALVLYDIRDGDAIMSWESDQPVSSLDYTSPIQWRDKGKLALAEHQAISVWDVNTMDMQCLQYVQLPGKHISAFYVHNADAECSGGVRQRLSSSDTEAYDGICCTQDDINILDFRVPNGVGISFPVPGQDMQSVYARGDMIFVAGLNKESHECGVQQWSLRKGAPVCAYAFPASSSHYTHLALTQVWGSSRMVMAVNGNGLYIFQGWKGATEGLCDVEEVKDVIGTQDLVNPSFDYSNSRVLLISRDRQASWSYWPHHWGMP